MLALFAATLKSGYGSISASGSFGSLSATAPATATSSTVTFTFAGPARNISLNYGGINDLEYNRNGAGYVNYGGSFSMTSGQTLAIRLNTPTVAEVDAVSVIDDSRAETVEDVSVIIV